ncbi:hypothetical protein B4099_1021 [Heyndrickxia coagulans]|uniref:Uncharacterized protein n=1 Tax=Heyndrickxia coagulans TaxID=1398 RepID=A0A150K4G7_HEYCO|nr:hypothetical protein B4099_1021 [Heyndrickxia coagulans]
MSIHVAMLMAGAFSGFIGAGGSGFIYSSDMLLFCISIHTLLISGTT